MTEEIKKTEKKIIPHKTRDTQSVKTSVENTTITMERKLIDERKKAVLSAMAGEKKVNTELKKEIIKENGDSRLQNKPEMRNQKTKSMRTNRPFNKTERKLQDGIQNKKIESNIKIDGKIEKKKLENDKIIEKKHKKKKHKIEKNRKQTGSEFEFKKPNLKIIPLGVLEEIGKNITVFEYEDEIILVDCGLEFPTDDMLGVDLVIPDVTYLIKNKEKIKGLFITHGHEDHIGAIPYILEQVNMPIYATRLTAKLIEHKLDEHHLLKTTKLTIVEQGQTINTGKMQVEFIRSSHSIPDAVMFAIHTPVGTIVHTGDF